MKGEVDQSGRALVCVSIHSSGDAPNHQIEVWIDTGFTGDLVLPQARIDQLSLEQSGAVKAVLADGTEVALKTYSCRIYWFGESRVLEVVANQGEYPLLGVGLLAQHELHISYRSGEITLD